MSRFKNYTLFPKLAIQFNKIIFQTNLWTIIFTFLVTTSNNDSENKMGKANYIVV